MFQRAYQLLLSISCVLFVSVAMAQGQTPAAETDENLEQLTEAEQAATEQSTAESQDAKPQPKTLDEIIVSAERRDQNLQDVPVAVSVFTSETRQVVGLDNMVDFAKHTPGLSYSNSDDRVFVRGIGRQTNTAGSDPGVAVYGDGAYDSSTVSINGSDFFVERLEVLRGPQGTLYGRNSIGGAINAISKRPKDETTLDARMGLSNYNAYSISFLMSVPFSEKVRASIGGSYGAQEDGFFENVASGETAGGAVDGGLAEAQVEIDFTDNVSTWFKFFVGTADMRPRSNNMVSAYDTAAMPSAYLTPGSALGYSQPSLVQLGTHQTNPGVDDPFKVNVNTESTADINEYYALLNHTTWSTKHFDIKLIASLRNYVYNAHNDLDGTDVISYNYPILGDPGLPCDLPASCVKVFPNFTFAYLEDRNYGSLELDFTSTGDGPLQWIGGLYYYKEALHQGVHFTTPDQPEMYAPVYLANQDDPEGTIASTLATLGLGGTGIGDEYPVGPAAPNPSGDVVTVDTYLTIASYALFGQVDYFFSDEWKGTFGLRYSYDEKSAEENLRVVCFGCGEPVLVGPGIPAFDVTHIAVSFDSSTEGVDSETTFREDGLANRRLKNNWSAGTGTIGLQWTPNDDLMTYGKISRGYKSGGFNAGGLVPIPQTEPEYVMAYELGSKYSYGGVLILNSSVFLNDYEGLQIPLTVPQASGINLTEFANLDKAVAYGLELEATWQATETLQIRAGYSYSDSEITSCCYVDTADPLAENEDAQPVPTEGGDGTVVAQRLDGEELNQLPRHKISLNVNHTTAFEPGLLIMSANMLWRDDMYATVFNRSYYKLESYFQFDLRAIFTTYDGRYRFIVAGKNLLNAESTSQASALPYITQPANGDRYLKTYGYNPPRQLGITFEANF